jgi:hypothetical protein
VIRVAQLVAAPPSASLLHLHHSCLLLFLLLAEAIMQETNSCWQKPSCRKQTHANNAHLPSLSMSAIIFLISSFLGSKPSALEQRVAGEEQRSDSKTAADVPRPKEYYRPLQLLLDATSKCPATVRCMLRASSAPHGHFKLLGVNGA